MATRSLDAARIERANLWWRIGSLAPAIIVLALLSIWPVFNLAYLSLADVKWVSGAAVVDFVGLQNFHELFTGEAVYWAGVRNTIVFAICAVSLQMVFGFTMALAVRRASKIGRSVLTAIFLLPTGR